MELFIATVPLLFHSISWKCREKSLNPCKGFRHFRQVFESLLSKNTFEKVTFLLLRFLWSSKENEETPLVSFASFSLIKQKNEETSYNSEIKYELGDLLKKKEETKAQETSCAFCRIKLYFNR